MNRPVSLKDVRRRQGTVRIDDVLPPVQTLRFLGRQAAAQSRRAAAMLESLARRIAALEAERRRQRPR